MKAFSRGGLLASLVVLVASGCGGPGPAEQAAMGVARLLVRNTGAVATLVNKDADCGFSSPAVLQAAQFQGDVGGMGSMTLTVTGCEMDLGEDTVVSAPDCNGTTVSASGKVTVSATRVLQGVLTGNPQNPVVPAGPDAVALTLTKVTFDQFKVVNSASKNVLTIQKGALTATLSPRLAVAGDSGACAVTTPNTAFSDIAVNEKLDIVIDGPDPVVAGVFGSRISAQNGVAADGAQNTIAGKIELSSKVHSVLLHRQQVFDLPVKGDAQGLDPEYDAGSFMKSYAGSSTCTPNLALPVSYACVDLAPKLSDGASRLTVKAFGTIAALVDKDANCGFSSDLVKRDAVLTGPVGGSGTLTLHTQNCVLNLPPNTVLPAACGGAGTKVGGVVRVTGSKVLSGRLTGDAATPVVPDSDSPATLTLTLTFDDFTVGSTADVNSLRVKSGTLAGSLQPRVALAADTAACSVTTGIARFSGLAYADAKLAVTGTAGTFDLPVSASSLDAVVGTWDADSNKLAGTVTVDGHAIAVPGDAMGLDPSFTQAAFDASWQCAAAAPNLVTPVTHDCHFVLPVAQGIARLTPRTLGAVATLVNADTTCGFAAAPGSASAPAVSLSSSVGTIGTLTQTIPAATPCEITLGLEHPISTDCNGGTLRAGGGKIRVSGTRAVTGRLTGDPAQPVIPSAAGAVVLDLRVEVVPETPSKPFLVRTGDATASLALVSGALSGRLKPRVALDPATGACGVVTPVTTFEDLAWDGATVSLVADGKQFNQQLSTSSLQAQNGTLGAVSNTLNGSLTMDGAAYAIPVPGADDKLDPAFDQAAFDAAWKCAPMGHPAPVAVTDDAQCSLLTALSGGVARLLVKDLARAVSLLDGDATCGFHAPSVLAAGMVSTPSTAQWDLSTTTCAAAVPSMPAPSCIAGLTAAYEGTLVATAHKTIRGAKTNLALPNPPVIPVLPQAATIDVMSMQLSNFAVADVAGGTAGSKLVLDGVASAQVSPVGGRSTAASAAFMVPVYSVSTPVGGFAGLNFTGDVTLVQAVPAGAPTGSLPRTFKLHVDSTSLSGFVGSYANAPEANAIAGNVVLEGVTEPVSGPLDPAYDQAAFDLSYACTPDLAATVTPRP